MTKTPKTPAQPSVETEIVAIESMLLFLERELRGLGFELAARQCRMVGIGIIEQQLHNQRLGSREPAPR